VRGSGMTIALNNQRQTISGNMRRTRRCLGATDELQMTGTKSAAASRNAAACTSAERRAGDPVLPAPISSLAGVKITTIEGLTVRSLQAAWVKHDVPQYVIASRARSCRRLPWLAVTPKPSDKTSRTR